MSCFSSHSWFALQVVHQHETRVASLLEYKGYERFCPTYKVTCRSGRRSHFAVRPLFPGYVFCKTTETCTGLICGTPGVIRFVSFGGRVAPIPDCEIEAVRRVISSDLDACPYVSSLEIGQKVQVRKGPLCGVIGRLICIKNRKRLLISVEIVMKGVVVDVDLNDIVPCEPRPLINEAIGTAATS